MNEWKMAFVYSKKFGESERGKKCHTEIVYVKEVGGF